jgi:hypothetical protein
MILLVYLLAWYRKSTLWLKLIRPLKEAQNWRPYLTEHHEGLLFAWKIKQGLQKK